MVEPGRAGLGSRRERPARGVHPVEHSKHVRGDRLHAQRDAGEPGGAQIVEQLRRRRLRIGLGGHLGVGRQDEVVADGVEHRRQPGATQQRRRSAADEHRLHRAAAHPCRPAASCSSTLQRREPAVGVGPPEFGGCVGVEVAVSASGRTERDVDVDAERPGQRGAHVGQRCGRRSDGHGTSLPELDFAHHERKSRTGWGRWGRPWHNGPRDCRRQLDRPRIAGGAAARRLQARLYLLLSALTP